MKRFDYEAHTDKDPSAVYRDVVGHWTGVFASYGYTLTSQGDQLATYHRKFRSAWLAIPVIFFFPVGLRALLLTSDATITTMVETDDESGDTIFTVNGRAPRSLCRSLRRVTEAA